jgi:hypothetical protein
MGMMPISQEWLAVDDNATTKQTCDRRRDFGISGAAAALQLTQPAHVAAADK